jgi:hypothetical protein
MVKDVVCISRRFVGVLIRAFLGRDRRAEEDA